MSSRNIYKLRKFLSEARNSDKPLVFAIPGSGLSAISAINGGIPFLAILNAGLYRISGLTSHASFFSYGNANDQTEKLISTQILPRCGSTPLVAGFLVGEAADRESKRFEKLRELGVAGIINWPPVSMNDGKFLDALRKRGYSEQSEADMLLRARENGFVTFGFSASPESAKLFATQARVDALIINVGWTLYGFEPLEKQDRIQFAIRQANIILDAIRDMGAQERPICLFYGGGINTVQDTLQLYRHTNVDGLGVGSAMEYFPVKDLIQGLSREYLNISRKKSLYQKICESPADFIGISTSVLELYQSVRKVASYNVNVCIEGESGAGKEIIANSLHILSPRHMGPFITVNCGSIPETLIESEFYGHEKGAFTGAHEKSLGKFELANHGTLFLDEVADLSPRAQVSLLRAIQHKEIIRIGGKKNIPVDIRIVAATNRCLKDMVAEGKFRADLFYRLNTIRLYVPPLRERILDIPALVSHILSEIRKKFGCEATGISKDFMRRLMQHSWPGNVRELQHVLTSAAIMESGKTLSGYAFIPEPGRNLPATTKVNDRCDSDNNAIIILDALGRSGGNKASAARMLGISRKTLYQRLEKYGIAFDKDANVWSCHP